MKKVKAIRVTSDNLENCLISEADYKELRLEMSTGDFHTHKAEEVMADPEELVSLYEEQE